MIKIEFYESATHFEWLWRNEKGIVHGVIYRRDLDLYILIIRKYVDEIEREEEVNRTNYDGVVDWVRKVAGDDSQTILNMIRSKVPE